MTTELARGKRIPKHAHTNDNDGGRLDGASIAGGVQGSVPLITVVPPPTPTDVKNAGRWELAVIPGSPPDPLDDGTDFLYIWVPGS